MRPRLSKQETIRNQGVVPTIAATASIIFAYFLIMLWIDAANVSRDFAISAVDFGPQKGGFGAGIIRPARWMNHHFQPYYIYCRLALGEPEIREF